MTRRSTAILLVALLLAGTGSAAWAAYSWVVRGSGEVRTAANLEPVVTLPRGVDGLHPGGEVPFQIKVHNPNSYPIRITEIEGHNPVAGGCKDYAVAVVKKTPQELSALVIGPRQTRSLDTRVTMKDWAPKECADRALGLDVVVRATQAL